MKYSLALAAVALLRYGSASNLPCKYWPSELSAKGSWNFYMKDATKKTFELRGLQFSALGETTIEKKEHYSGVVVWFRGGVRKVKNLYPGTVFMMKTQDLAALWQDGDGRGVWDPLMRHFFGAKATFLGKRKGMIFSGFTMASSVLKIDSWTMNRAGRFNDGGASLSDCEVDVLYNFFKQYVVADDGAGISAADINKDAAKPYSLQIRKISECAMKGNCQMGLLCNDRDQWNEGGMTCVDIDECQLRMDDPIYGLYLKFAKIERFCEPGHLCVNKYEGYDCVEINECEERDHPCYTGYECNNTVGSYTCDDVDECADPALNDCGSGPCRNTLGGFKCL